MRAPSYVSDPQVVYLHQILDDLQQGIIQVPRFQRESNLWTTEQQLELLRSILIGIPIGAILLWRTSRDDLACYAQLGAFSIPSPAQSGPVRQYLLDGLQRLTTLLFALRSTATESISASAPSESKAFYFDLNNNDFVLMQDSPPLGPNRRLLPLRVLLDSVALLRYQRGLSSGGSEADIQIVDLIAAAFRNHKIAIIPVVTDDLSVAVRTFQKVNSAGTEMSELHMVHALSWSPKFDLQERLEEVKARYLAPVGWQDLDDDLVLATCKAALGLDMYKASEARLANALRNDPQVLDDAVQRLAEVARLLQTECGVWVPSLLPYGLQAVALAEALRANPFPDVDIKQLLTDWFWLSSFTELFTGLSGARVQKVLSDLHEMGLQRMSMRGEAIWSGRWPLTRQELPLRYDTRQARAHLLVLQLARLQPRGGPNGALLDVQQHLRTHGTRALCRMLPRVPQHRTQSSSPATRFFFPEEQAPQLRGLLDGSGWPRYVFNESQSAHDARLLLSHPQFCESHLVPQAALLALKAGREDDFRNLRIAALNDMENRFFALLAKRYQNRLGLV